MSIETAFREAQFLRSKDGQKFNNLQKKQCKIMKALNILLSTVHNIIKRLKESGRTLINVKKCDLWAL